MRLTPSVSLHQSNVVTDACLPTRVVPCLQYQLHYLKTLYQISWQIRARISTSTKVASSSTTTSTPAMGFPLEQDERSQHDLPTLPSSDSKEISTHGVPTEEEQWLSGVPLSTVLGAVCLVCFLMLLDTSIVVTAIPQITSQFHSFQDVGWYGSAYQLARWAGMTSTGN